MKNVRLRAALKFFNIVLIFLSGCSTLKSPQIEASKDYQSPIEAISKLSQILKNQNINNGDRAIVSSIYSEIFDFQKSYHKELSDLGEINLVPGKSYEFELESFCLDPGINQPLWGDGMRPQKLDGVYKSWVLQILEKYRANNLSQEQAQILIWSLRSGTSYKELSAENKRNLNLIFEDASTKFSDSSLIKQVGTEVLDMLPESVRSTKERLASVKAMLQDSQQRYEDLAREISPPPQSRPPQSLGWFKTSEGYYLNLTSKGYQSTNVKIYVPKDMKPGRKFRPAEYVGSRKDAQKISLSRNITKEFVKEYASKSAYYLGGQQLTAKEKELVIFYPLDAARVGYYTVQSGLMSNRNFPGATHLNDKADAYRHFVWSALLARNIGESRAKEFLDAHEENPENPFEEKRMDLHNNAEGMRYAREYKGNNFELDVEKGGLDKVKKKELLWLK